MRESSAASIAAWGMGRIGTRHASLTLYLALSLAGCGGSSPQTDASADAAFDAPHDASVDVAFDATRDAIVDSTVGVDAGSDVGVGGCRSNADCATEPINVRCDYEGRCVPALCQPLDTDRCREPLSCVRGQCLARVCPPCASGMACDPGTTSCVAATSPVSCRAMGGMYVRGRCMTPEEPAPDCDGGYASEPLARSCDVPVIPGANLGSASIVRIGAFPVARSISPVPGTLAVHRPWRGGESIIWEFDYLDLGVSGSGVMADLELFPTLLGDDRSGGCIRPGAPGFAAQPLCALLPPNSDCNCGQIPISSIARDERDRLAVAGRDDTDRAHFELWDKALPGEPRRRVISYYTPAPSEVWSPLVIGPHPDETIFARVGLSAPLGLVELMPAVPYALFASDAGLTAAGEFVAWPDGKVIAKRASDGALLRFAGSVDAPDVLAASGAPTGRYRVTQGRAAGPLLLVRDEAVTPSSVALYGDPRASGDASAALDLLGEEPNLGPAAAIATAGDLAWIFAAVPHASGGFTLERVALSRTAGPSRHTTLITSEDVGGEIVGVTDVALHWKLRACTVSVASVLVGAMLDIRQSDDSVVHELWAVEVTWR